MPHNMETDGAAGVRGREAAPTTSSQSQIERRGREAAPTTSSQFRNNSRGFTLIEIMVVLVILGMIAGLVYTAVFPRVEEAKQKTARAQIEILGLSLDNFRLDVGSYPATLQELVESSAQNWKGPYLRKKLIPPDPWGNPYTYEVVEEGNSFHLSSTGGGKKPINSWE